MCKCFVVQESPGKNLVPARDFGEIHVMLLTNDVNRGLEHCTEVLRNKLVDFQCDKDFLILIGDPILMGIAMIFAFHVSDDQFQVLRWNREGHRYEPININLFLNERSH